MSKLISYPKNIYIDNEKYYPDYPWITEVRLDDGTVIVITIKDDEITMKTKALLFPDTLYNGDFCEFDYFTSIITPDKPIVPTAFGCFLRSFLCQLAHVEIIPCYKFDFPEYSGTKVDYLPHVPADMITSPLMCMLTEVAMTSSNTNSAKVFINLVTDYIRRHEAIRGEQNLNIISSVVSKHIDKVSE